MRSRKRQTRQRNQNRRVRKKTRRRRTKRTRRTLRGGGPRFTNVSLPLEPIREYHPLPGGETPEEADSRAWGDRQLRELSRNYDRKLRQSWGDRQLRELSRSYDASKEGREKRERKFASR